MDIDGFVWLKLSDYHDCLAFQHRHNLSILFYDRLYVWNSLLCDYAHAHERSSDLQIPHQLYCLQGLSIEIDALEDDILILPFVVLSASHLL